MRRNQPALIMLGSTLVASRNVTIADNSLQKWVHMPPKMTGYIPSPQSSKLTPADTFAELWLCGATTRSNCHLLLKRGPKVLSAKDNSATISSPQCLLLFQASHH